MPYAADRRLQGTYINRRIDAEAFSDAVAYLVLGLGALCSWTAHRDFLAAGTADQGSSLLRGAVETGGVLYIKFVTSS